jgi:cell division protein ZapA
MAHVTITVGSRNYSIACDDGEEDHLHQLAATIDQRAAELGRTVGPVGEARLFLMTSLVLADEISERADQVMALETELEKFRSGGPEAATRVNQAEAAVAQVLEAASRRIEDIAQRLS